MVLSRRGISTGYVTGDQDSNEVMEAVTEGEYQVVYLTPEMLLDSRKYRECYWGTFTDFDFELLLLMRPTQ